MYSLKDHFTFQQSLFFPVLRMMNRGIRIDVSQKAALRDALIKAQFERQERLDYLAGHPLNPNSPTQLSEFFYNDLGIPGVKNLTGDSLTTDVRNADQRSKDQKYTYSGNPNMPYNYSYDQNMGGQNPSLGRYRPPMMDANGRSEERRVGKECRL